MSKKDQPQFELGADPRLDFLFDYVTRSLKIKMDKWQKMFLVEDYKNLLTDFFDKEEREVCNFNF